MEKIIQDIITAVGGRENINSCTNCLTRLRLTLKNSSIADHAKIKRITGVFGIIEADQQFQIVLGPNKAQKASEILNKLVA